MMSRMTPLSRMWVGLAALAAGLGLAGSTARADPIQFDPDGAAAANGTLTVGSFGFDTANTLAQASISGGQIVAPGSTFQLFFQTRLSNLTLPGGGTVTPAGLNGSAGGPAFEITLVGSVTEQVLTVAPGGGAATFQTAAVQNPLSFIRMFYHAGLLSDNFTGAGFAVGTQILAAVPSAALGSSGNFSVSVNANGQPVGVGPFDTFDPPASVPGVAYAGVTSVSGSGSAIVNAGILAADPNFFKSPIFSVRFDAFDNVPFTATTPSQFFNNFANLPVVPANHGAINGVSGPDFQFQSRTSANFSAVPEPASVGLVALGLAGLFGYSWRKRRPSA